MISFHPQQSFIQAKLRPRRFGTHRHHNILVTFPPLSHRGQFIDARRVVGREHIELLAQPDEAGTALPLSCRGFSLLELSSKAGYAPEQDRRSRLAVTLRGASGPWL